MEFASKKVWVPKRTAELAEDIDADEVTGGVRYTSAKAVSQAPRPPAAERVHLDEGANTNIVALRLGELKDGVSVTTGDLVLCPCGAAFSHLSKIVAPVNASDNNNNNDNSNSNAGVWTCEFCGAANNVSMEKEEMPAATKVDYVLSGPTVSAAPAADAYTVIFVVDTSGSMCSSVPVTGGLRIKSGQAPSNDVLAFREGGAAQYLPNERHGEQYVSRLQCVVAAVEAQVQALHKSKPDVRVGLVTFASDVAIVGDGSAPAVVVTGDRLQNVDELLVAGAEHAELRPVSQSSATLVAALAALEERGTTALGPGLCVAVGMLKGAPPGSKIVLLTDGLANQGCGSIEDADAAQADAFYRRIALQAKGKGVACSVVAIKGSKCKMEILGMLAEESGGEVDIVDPADVAKNFATILEDEVFATECELRLILHRGFQLSDPEFEGLSVASKSVGNITALSNVSFEFRVRTDDDAAKLSSEPRLPFQVQIRYRRLDGSRLIRVVTEAQEVTSERKEAEDGVNVDVLASNAVQQAAYYAASGRNEKARTKMVAQQRMMARASPASPAASTGYNNYLQHAQQLDDAMLEQERDEAPQAAMQNPMYNISESRRETRSDALSNAIYQQKAGKKFSRK